MTGWPGKTPILVTGGAGYIGAHAVLALRRAGYPVVVLDNLTTGRRSNLAADVPLVVGDCGDTARVGEVIARHEIAAIMHFAGSIIVSESVDHPLAYYANNTGASRNLIDTAVAAGCRAFVFSSTAAVYGDPAQVPIDEDQPAAPINPYGRSKLMTEWILADTYAAHGLPYASLRYFNVAGADPEGRCGQVSPKSTHLIKLACETALGKRDRLKIFGTDYPTADGTCVRDYIHVVDLVEAHVMALDDLLTTGRPLVANLGYGHGFSVRAVIAALECVVGARLPVTEAPRRPGDPPALVADSTRAQKRLGWRPQFDDLTQIVSHALAWERLLSRLD